MAEMGRRARNAHVIAWMTAFPLAFLPAQALLRPLPRITEQPGLSCSIGIGVTDPSVSSHHFLWMNGTASLWNVLVSADEELKNYLVRVG
jgi:hypothetical protein